MSDHTIVNTTIGMFNRMSEELRKYCIGNLTELRKHNDEIELALEDLSMDIGIDARGAFIAIMESIEEGE